MALALLARRMRPRLPLAANSRPLFTRVFNPSSKGEHPNAIRRFNIESASEEEIRHEQELIRRQIKELSECVSKDEEKMDGIFEHMFGTVKMVFGSIALIELLSFAGDVRHSGGTKSVEPEEPRKCLCCGTRLPD